jgi:Mor family transcriptional regulator
MIARGRMRHRYVYGEDRAVKLNNEKVREIFVAYHDGESTASLAKRFDLSTATVHHIAIREIWVEVTADLPSGSLRKSDRMLRGDQHPMARISQDIADQMRRDLDDGMSRREVANKYGISNSVVQRVATGQQWVRKD